MNRIALLLCALGANLSLLGQGPAAPHVSPPAPFGALPTPNQLHWQEMEMYCLIHFGANTYLDHEWGYGDEDPRLINPTEFDARQIVGAARAGGFKGVIVVAKHHDGLCLWPSKTTEHTIAASNWKGGKGDILKEYQEACQALGMQLGVYCSPWDRNNAAYGTHAYVDIYRAQLMELYSNYGPLFMSWHDGANGGDGYYGGARETRKIDRSTYYGWDSTWAITQQMQPGAVIFGDIGPGVRWVGNEEGHAGTTYWATFTPESPDPGHAPAPGYIKSELATEGTRHGKYWMPAECDVPLRPGWFYHASQDAQVKSPAQLLDLYYASVGRGAGLDLGLAPDKRGLLADEDVESLRVFGYLLKATFAVNLAKGARITASNVRGGDAAHYGPAFLLDDDRYSYWATDDSVTNPSVTLDLGRPVTFNVLRLRENIKLGQRIDSFAVDVFAAGAWTEVIKGTTIGPNRLVRLQQPLSASRVRVRITGSPVCIALSDAGLFLEPKREAAPVISRDQAGVVMIHAAGAPHAVIRYTLDRTAPSPKSLLYAGPIILPDGGTVRASTFGQDNIPGDVGTQVFGVIKKDWKVMSGPGEQTSHAAIDENEATSWNTLSLGAAFPQDLTVDMNRSMPITGFSYLPSRDGGSEGLINRYCFYTSDNGTDWTKVKEGTFSNIAANPVEQFVPLDHPKSARYFRFSALGVIRGNGVSAAEIGIRVK